MKRNKTIADISTKIEKYFKLRNWKIKKCKKCNLLFFTKNNFSNCGSSNCNTGYSFLTTPSPKKFLDINDFHKNFTTFFNKSGLNYSLPKDIVRINERTLFSSAAGQIFDDAIHNDASVKTKKLYLIQPVIRLRCINQLGVTEGMLSSFLNAATELWQSSPKEHLDNIDMWLNYLSSCGLWATNLTIAKKLSINTWGDKTVESAMLFFNYGGLELGVANYFNIHKSKEQQINMSDMSFGLERIAWAVNKTSSCFDTIGPLSYSLYGKISPMDTIRTLVLMAGAGVVPAQKNQGSKFKLLAKKLGRIDGFSLDEMVEYYYTHWSNFINLHQPIDKVRRIIQGEYEANKNKKIGKLANFNGDHNITHEQFLRLITKKKIKVDDLRKLLNK